MEYYRAGKQPKVPPKLELKREIELLHLKIKNLRKTYDSDKLQIASKKRRLFELQLLFDELQNHKGELLSKRAKSPNKRRTENQLALYEEMGLPQEVSSEENLEELRKAIQLVRDENQMLSAQIVKNDVLVRLGPHMGTLALRVKRTIDGRKYSDLQRREAEARHEVSALSFHLRNEESRLHQARMQSNGVIKNDSQKADNKSRAQQVAFLNDKLKNSRARLGALARQRAEAAKEEEQLNARIKKLQEQLMPRH